MIQNEREYKITKQALKNMQDALANAQRNIDSQPNASPEWIHKAHCAGLESQISDLATQLREYELLKSGNIRIKNRCSLAELPLILIQARIAKGFTQKSLGHALGVSEQQIQRYESSSYSGANLARLSAISEILGVTITEEFEGATQQNNNTEQDGDDSIFSWDGLESINWSEFPFKEMSKRGWLDASNEAGSFAALQNFIRSGGPTLAAALHRKKFRGESKPNEYALLAWQARALQLARKEKANYPVHLRSDLPRQLASLSLRPNAPAAVKELLASHGIILVVEEHLSKTYLDGAAMRLEDGRPVIGLTLRYDRLDHFWFVLMHELGHVYLHLNDKSNMDFFDGEDGAQSDILEDEADHFAQENLLPSDSWNTCLSRFSTSTKAVELDAKRLNIHPSIIAGRIRKDRNDWTIFNDLIGNGSVRRAFGV